MKTVVNNSMVAHLWAAQSQPHARNSANSFWFRDSVIYSYGSHFPIARHVNGQVLMTTQDSSITTCKHKSIVSSAIRHLPIIKCVNPLATAKTEHQNNLSAMREACLTQLEKASRARTYTQMYLSNAEDYVTQHATYRTFFGLDLDEVLVISETWKKEAHGRIAAQDRINKARRAETKKREEQRRAQQEKDLEEWKTDLSTWRTFYSLPVALRVNGENVQTSHGAEVPITHAKRVYQVAKDIRAGINPPYIANGHTLYCGAFKVQSIDANGTLVAGCHTITFDAMKELGDKLGW